MKRIVSIADGLLELVGPGGVSDPGRQREMPHADRLIWMLAMGLMALGTVMVLSSSIMLADRKFGTPGFFWSRQLIWWALAVAILFALSRVDHRRLRRYAPFILLTGTIGLVVVLLLPPVRDVHRWIAIGPLRWQPAEGFRLAFIVFAAAFLANRAEHIIAIRSWILLIIVLIAASALLLLQPEFSAVLLLWATAGVMLIAAGVRWRHILPAIAAVIVAAFVVVYGFGYKTERVDAWRDGLAAEGGSYQVKQSKVAFGSGGVFGQGLGHGRSKLLYLPEPHTDFMISSIGEEFGLVGVSAVWAAFGLLIYRGWKAAMRAPDRFGYLLCIGVGGSLLANATLHTAVATGLSPATGVPLPFVSYGGSSLLCTAAAWGLVLNVSRYRMPRG